MTAVTSERQVLSAVDVAKVFGGTHALKGVDFTVASGRVTALLGENGAGKSTLMKILAGIETPTTGVIELDGAPVQFSSPRDATDRGIAIIHQELSLCPNLSVQDNLFLGREVTGRLGIDRTTQQRLAREVLGRLGEDIDPRVDVGELRLGQQQIVEIARALLQEARVLIMDEPTSALSAPEIKVLFRVIRELTQSGVAIVYISHHLDEALEIADDIVVLRDGRMVARDLAANVDVAWMVAQMVGRRQDSLYPDRHSTPGGEVLVVRDLVVADPTNPHRVAVDQLSLTVHAGEMVGLYGLMGSGRTELLEALAGRLTPSSGQLLLNGEPLTGATVSERIARGLVLVPEDRQRDGLVQTLSVGKNLSLASMQRFVRRGFVSDRDEDTAVRSMSADVTVKASGPNAPITSLSGGNQQKVVIGKALMTEPRVLLLDEPSRGVDVGAKADVFELMAGQARQGLAVLFTTSEAEEALHVPDRLLVLARGRVVGEFARGDINREELMSVADIGSDATAQQEERS